MAPTNPAYDQARAAAAEDARRRAQSYATALGLSVGPVAWVAEPGLRRDPGPPVPLEAGVAPMAAAVVPPGDTEPERVTPAELTVRVDVEVGFTILDASGMNDPD
jgi:uncharacterized protein YggE